MFVDEVSNHLLRYGQSKSPPPPDKRILPIGDRIPVTGI